MMKNSLNVKYYVKFSRMYLMNLELKMCWMFDASFMG